MEHWILWVLGPLAAWILLNGADDLFIDLVFLWRGVRRWLLLDNFYWPSAADLDRTRQRRIAVFVPLWHEHEVIAAMLEHNLAAIRYEAYEFFVGVYPNDAATLAAVGTVAARDTRVHIAMCGHDGPTSKADCLNWIYQRMREYEESGGERFDIVMTHDAEDLIHPESLRLVNHFGRTYDMVQVPVLALPTPMRELTHGLYCDDFAEFQSKDIPVRQYLRGFLPSNGVGTGYSRGVLERLAAEDGRVFEPQCLTEDYENGYRVHSLGYRQICLPIQRMDGSLAATREYFPRSFGTARKQRTRWTMGIGLQGWERHGWRAPPRQLYWFWRDRKALVGNLMAPLANLFFFYGAASWVAASGRGRWMAAGWPGAGMRWVFAGTLASSVMHLGFRTACVARIYGWRFASGVPVRAVWGNWLNFVATMRAIGRFAVAKARHRTLVWVKTEHAYPSRSGLTPHKRRIGEILVAQGDIDRDLLELALRKKPAGERLGEYLVRMGLLSARGLYEGLSLQQNLPLGLPPASPVALRATRTLPAWVAKKWKVLPFGVAEGELFLAGPEVPSDGMTRELRRFSRLGLRFHLVTPGEFEVLARTYLP